MRSWYRHAIIASVGLLSTVWFGLTAARLIIVYDLFEPGRQQPRPIPIDQQLDRLRLAENVALASWGCYLLLVIATAAMIVLWRRNLRCHGYILMAALLIGCSLFWQSFLVPLEMRLLQAFPSRTLAPHPTSYTTIMPIVVERFFVRSAADFLSLLVAGTVVGILAVRPLSHPDAHT